MCHGEIAMRVTLAALIATFWMWTTAGGAVAQSEPDSAVGTPAQSEQASDPVEATWEGLPFSSLSDYENKIPIGMSRRDLMHTLGRPAAIMPGQGSDQVYHYEYNLPDGGELRAVVIVRDAAVLIRRLYISSPTGAMTRAN
jgi:hypothetical protein